MKLNTLTGMMALVGMSTLVTASRAPADDLETQAKNKTEDVKAGTKKGVRKSKKAVRKATGNDSAAKDMKDTMGDVKDDATKNGNKLKNEVSQ